MHHSEKHFILWFWKVPCCPERIMSVLWDIDRFPVKSVHFHVSHFYFTLPLNKRIRVLFNQLIYLSFSQVEFSCVEVWWLDSTQMGWQNIFFSSPQRKKVCVFLHNECHSDAFHCRWHSVSISLGKHLYLITSASFHSMLFILACFTTSRRH